jgi:hypothetical protein
MQLEQLGKSLYLERVVCFDFYSGVSAEIWKLAKISCDELESIPK